MTSCTGLLILNLRGGKALRILRYEARACKHLIYGLRGALEKNTPALLYYSRQQICPPGGDAGGVTRDHD
ncbi:MAG TPA: hypothetical protein VKE91_00385 [Blastocatellia bacterium]|nr:hypothetical protein [Blastocatellia bacterium]